MGKSKHFFFAVAIPVIMLFTLGNWVTSARATSTGINDATPIPQIQERSPKENGFYSTAAVRPSRRTVAGTGLPGQSRHRTGHHARATEERLNIFLLVISP
jgi:hypothetical protein